MITDSISLREQALRELLAATQRLCRHHCDFDLNQMALNDIHDLEHAIETLAAHLHAEAALQDRLDQIVVKINAGLTLDEVLNNIYESFYTLVPYNRIGFSIVDEIDQTVTAIWARSDLGMLEIAEGYSAPLAGSSLETILTTGRPRVINDLEAYLAEHPNSESTRRIMAEGIRSSLTCPLEVEGRPVGFLFFSGNQPHTYHEEHISIFQRIARQLAVIVGKGRLISQIKQREQEIKAKNKELARLNGIKNTFVGIAAHDLRNPLSSILMGTGFLLDTHHDISEEQLRSILRNVHGQAEHMASLIDDLLDVTQIESGELELNMDFIDAEDFLTETIQRNAHLADPKHTAVLLEHIDEGVLAADCRRLRQIVDNLISNAVKFSPPGSTVNIRAEHKDSQWRISVQDEGPGITEADRPRLFTEFARLSAQPTGEEKSTGLGLAIVARIVQAHQGTIGVDSVPGQGATFWFTLPDIPPDSPFMS